MKPNSPPLRARLLPLAEARGLEVWRSSLRLLAKDHRYYELVADTLGGQFDCGGLLLENDRGEAIAVQPCFFVDQDLVLTAPRAFRAVVGTVRKFAPRFLRLRMLMAGCAAGEGHPVAPDLVPTVSAAMLREARKAGAALAVWKDVPSGYREQFSGGLRIPSMPATRLALEFASFDDYLARHLSHAMRKNLRRKFKAAPVLQMEVLCDLGAQVAEVHALYLQVLARSQLQFERLTPEFLRELGARMPDRARFFLWRQEGRLIAASICLVHDGALYDEYLGLDYRVALDLHLYFVTFRDLVSWALAQGLRAYHSTPLGYEPKLHLGFALAPLDLYIASPHVAMRGPVRWAMQAFGPTRGEPLLTRFPNAREL